MVLKKCVKCNKNITKTKPGLTCSRCNKIVHSDTNCVKLSNKQLNTLRNSPGIEWSCEDCQKNISRRSSFIIPDDDDVDNDSDDGSVNTVQALDTKKLVKEISRELKKTFREEIANLESSLEFLSDQITTMEQSLRNQENTIKKLENRNEDLVNKNKNLELRVTVLEQGLRISEQKSLSRSVEIAGMPDIITKDVPQVIQKVASKLELNEHDIQTSQKMSGSKEKPGPILIELKTALIRKQWVDAGKEKCLTVGDVLPNAPKEKAEHRIFIREALTKHVKTLLYNAKMQLNKSYKYIWCRDGKVLVRKDDNGKIIYIRSQQDIDLLSKPKPN